MRTQIERLDLAGQNGSEVSAFIDGWRAQRDEGWDVTVLLESAMRRGLKVHVALVALACADGTAAAKLGVADGPLPDH